MAILLDPNDDAATNGSSHLSPLGKSASRNGEPLLRPSHAAARKEFWTAAAPKQLRRGGADVEVAWESYWSKRTAPATVARLVHAEGSPLAWGWDRASLSEECRALFDIADELARGAAASKFSKGKRQDALQVAVAEWLEAARDGHTNVSFALGCLAAAHVLHQLGGHLGPEHGWALLDFLAATAEDARHWAIDVDGPAGTALAQQLAAGELPLTLAYCFPEMAPLAELARPARRRLSDGLAELAGEEGLVRAAHLDSARGLTACWTRSRAIGQRLDRGGWNDETQSTFQRVVRQSLRWTRAADGLPLLAGATATPWTADFLAAALREGGRKADAAAARTLLADTRLTGEIAKSRRKPPRTAAWSEPATLAVLRTDWSAGAATVAIDYSALGMRIEIAAAGRPLFEGVWTASSHIDGRLLKAAGAWEEVCWFNDADVDYIEFALQLEGGARLERQILLARKDGFLLLADHLQAAAPGTLEHEWQLPLAADLGWRGEQETRDAVLTTANDAGPVVRVMPLALPEWRIDPRVGELAHVDGAMRLAERAEGRALACPLFLDLKPERVAKPSTWRQLTIAEWLQIQPPDVAVAYRVQCGKKQWAIYRSLAPRGNRSFLGQNTSCEFYVARFQSPSGEVKELIQVEG